MIGLECFLSGCRAKNKHFSLNPLETWKQGSKEQHDPKGRGRPDKVIAGDSGLSSFPFNCPSHASSPWVMKSGGEGTVDNEP